MGFLKRLCLFVFGLCGLVAIAALGLTWFGPWSAAATSLLGAYDAYYYAVQGACAVAALGCVVCLLRSVFVRNRKVIIVSRDGQDSISVTRDAVASQATHLIEEDGRFRVRGVSVRAKKFGHVRVFVRVQPLETVDVVAEGKRMHDELVGGISTIVGDNVDGVSLEFARADYYADQSNEGFEAPWFTDGESAALTSEPTEDVSALHEPEHQVSNIADITVSVGPNGAVADSHTMEEE